jgi:hypothetical protein
MDLSSRIDSLLTYTSSKSHVKTPWMESPNRPSHGSGGLSPWKPGVCVAQSGTGTDFLPVIYFPLSISFHHGSILMCYLRGDCSSETQCQPVDTNVRTVANTYTDVISLTWTTVPVCVFGSCGRIVSVT